MNIIKNVRDFILEDEFELKILEGRINIVNYTSIGHFDNSKVIIYYEKGEIIIKGENLTVNKLMNDEVLITGKVVNIELRWLNEK